VEPESPLALHSFVWPQRAARDELRAIQARQATSGYYLDVDPRTYAVRVRPARDLSLTVLLEGVAGDIFQINDFLEQLGALRRFIASGQAELEIQRLESLGSLTLPREAFFSPASGLTFLGRRLELAGSPASLLSREVAATRSSMDAFEMALAARIASDPVFAAEFRARLAAGVAAGDPNTLAAISRAQGATMSSPFPLTFASTTTGGIPPGAMVPTGTDGGFLSSILSSLPSLLTGLAQAGVIRGSVGQALAPMVSMTPAGMVPSTSFVPAGLTGILGPIMNNPGAVLGGASLAVDAMQALAGLFGGGSSCGRGQPVVDAPQLFRMNACGGMTLPSRIQVRAPNGSIYILASLGRAVRGSREAGVMRRLAKDNGFTVARRGSARARGRRRPR